MGILDYLILTIVLSGTVFSYPYGPPNTDYVCRQMFPVGHGVDAQYSEPPYEIQLSQNIYNEGYEDFRVTVQALHGYYIGGLFIQARRAGDCGSIEQKKPVGVFKLLPGERYLRTMSCNNRINSSLSHNQKKALDHAVFKWFAPARPIGHIYLVATIVKERTKFWTTVFSDIIRDTNSSAQPVICPVQMLLDPETKYTTGSPTTSNPNNGSTGQFTNLFMIIVIVFVSYIC